MYFRLTVSFERSDKFEGLGLFLEFALGDPGGEPFAKPGTAEDVEVEADPEPEAAPPAPSLPLSLLSCSSASRIITASTTQGSASVHLASLRVGRMRPNMSR